MSAYLQKQTNDKWLLAAHDLKATPFVEFSMASLSNNTTIRAKETEFPQQLQLGAWNGSKPGHEGLNPPPSHFPSGWPKKHRNFCLPLKWQLKPQSDSSPCLSQDTDQTRLKEQNELSKTPSFTFTSSAPGLPFATSPVRVSSRLARRASRRGASSRRKSSRWATRDRKSGMGPPKAF